MSNLFRPVIPFSFDCKTLTSPDLSWKAKGIWVYLMTTQDQEISYNKLLSKSEDGESSCRSGVTELREFGLLSIDEVRNPDGSFSHHVWTVRDL